MNREQIIETIDKLTPDQIATLSKMITSLLNVLEKVSPGALPIAIVLLKAQGTIEIMIDAPTSLDALKILQRIKTVVNRMPSAIQSI